MAAKTTSATRRYAGERRSPIIFASRHFRRCASCVGMPVAARSSRRTPARSPRSRSGRNAVPRCRQPRRARGSAGRNVVCRPRDGITLKVWCNCSDWRPRASFRSAAPEEKQVSMAALVREMSAGGERVLATTTTRMAAAKPKGHGALARSAGRSVCSPVRMMAPEQSLPIGRLIWSAASSLVLRRRRSMPLCERVDSTGSSLKRTAQGIIRSRRQGPNEPVFPCTTGAVVIVVGASGIGMPLDEDTVFRAEAWSALTGLPVTRPVTPESVARMVVDPEGLGKGAPKHARRILFVNQADTQQRREAATQVLDCVFSMSGLVPERAVVGSLQPSPSIQVLRERECSIEANA